MMTCFNHVQSSRNCLNTLPSARVLKVNAILEFSMLEIFNASFIWFQNSSQIIKYMNFILNFSLIEKNERQSKWNKNGHFHLKIRVFNYLKWTLVVFYCNDWLHFYAFYVFKGSYTFWMNRQWIKTSKTINYGEIWACRLS